MIPTGHKFAYWTMFWSPCHLTMSVAFLVMDVLRGHMWDLVAIWAFNIAVSLVFLFTVFPSRFRELTEGDECQKGNPSLIRTV